MLYEEVSREKSDKGEESGEESFVKQRNLREQVRGHIFIRFVKVSLRGSTVYDTERATFLSWPPRNRRFR